MRKSSTPLLYPITQRIRMQNKPYSKNYLSRITPNLFQISGVKKVVTSLPIST